MTDLGPGGDLEDAALADLQAKLLQAQGARSRLESHQGDTPADGVGRETTETSALSTRLATLQGELVQARASLGPRHPKILQLESEIEAARSAMATSAAGQLAQVRELEGKYQAELSQARQKLLDRRVVQDQGAKLVLEQKLAEDAYAQALRGLDQVQFASQGNYQDVTLISRAEPPLRASAQNKLKKFAAAIAASLALAFGVPFAYELLLNRRIRCRDDLERGSGS